MLSQAVDTQWLLELLTAGGAPGVALIVLLLLLSLAAFALAVEQFLSLRESVLAPEGLSSRVAKRLDSGDLLAAQRACDEHACFLGEVIRTAIDEARELSPAVTWQHLEKSMEDTIEAGSAKLLRRVDYLSVIGNLAPMVGLLGTVVGMILAFKEVAATQGAATAGELASGIYQALVTTVGGLLVAIPSLAAYAVLRSRVDAITAVVALEAERATRPLKKALLRGSGPRVVAPPRTGTV